MVADQSRLDPADRWFRDPISGEDCLLVLAPRLGIAHPDCAELADVTPPLDAFYCTACKWNGRVSGTWVAAMYDAEQNRAAESVQPLTFAQFRAVSQSRSARWHTPDTEPWTSADWSNAMGGEVGELVEAALALLDHLPSPGRAWRRLRGTAPVDATLTLLARLAAANGHAGNTVKKLRRHETGLPDVLSVEQLREDLADEIGDVVAYADLLAAHFGFDLGDCVAGKFNRVSEREGFPERLPLSTRPAVLTCRQCGCTEDDCSGCIERTGYPCAWVERIDGPDNLCTACVP